MSTHISESASTQKPNTSLNPSAYTSLLYAINNFSYRLQKFSFAGLIEHLAVETSPRVESQPYFLMGERISSFRQCLQAQKELIFFSYRKNFKLTTNVTSDFGWGCLLRVGQMALAQAIRLHLSYKQDYLPNRYIIQSFLEAFNTNSPYSIQKLTNEAKSLWNKNIGQWYSMIEMLSVVQETHRKYSMRGAQGLVIKIYNETLEIDDLFKELQDFKSEQGHLSSELEEKFTDGEQPDLNKAIYKLPINKSQNKTIMLVVNTKLGHHQINECEFKKLLALMELPLFMGCIAGINGKAKFITGKHGQSLSFLDPHLVQQASELKQEDLQTFTCEDYMLMSKDKLNPEVSVCFFIKNSSDLQILMQKIDLINKQNQSDEKRKFIAYNHLNELNDYGKSIQLITRFSLSHSQELQNIQILEQIEQDNFESSSFTLIS